MIKIQNCPACGNTRKKEVSIEDIVYECTRCGCIYGKLTLGQSYKYVSGLAKGKINKANIKPFDLICLSSKGIIRRHGWYDPNTKKVVQVG